MKIKLIFLGILLILLNPCINQMNVFPDQPLAYDSFFNSDIIDATVPNKQIMWSYSMGTTSYPDYWQGIVWLPNDNMCYRKANKTLKADYLIGQVIINPSVKFSITCNKYLWDEVCVGDANDGIYMPLYFHHDNNAVIYYLRFYFMNPDNTPAEFTLSFESFRRNAADTNKIHDLQHPANIVVPANSLYKYELKITLRNNGGNNGVVDFGGIPLGNQNQGRIVYWLQEEAYANQYDTDYLVWTPYVVIPPATPEPYPTFWSNTQVIGNIVTAYPTIQASMTLIINYNVGRLALAGFAIVTDQINNSMTGNNSCLDTRKCSIDRGCVGGNCNTNCNDTCKSCNGGGVNQCTECYPTSSNWNIVPQPAGICPIDHMDFTYITTPLIMNVQPSIHYTVTFDFWMWAHNTVTWNNLMVNITYQDFMIINVHANPGNAQNLEVVCVPFEYWYPQVDPVTGLAIITDRTTFRNYFVNNASGTYYDAFTLNDTITKASSTWFHTRCSYSFKLKKAYINNSVEYTLPIPQYYEGETGFSTYLKKFYHDNQTVNLTIDMLPVGHTDSIYIKNLNIFRDYIPQFMDTLKYFNLYKSQTFDLPQLLFSAPFDDLDPQTNLFSTYDFSRKIVATPAAVKTTYTIVPIAAQPRPSYNFRRLNLLDPYQKYSECDLLPTQKLNLACGAANSQFCYDDNSILNCQVNNYLWLGSNTCDSRCPAGVMRMPADTTYVDRAWCQLPCHLNTQNCPFDNANYKDLNSFVCQNNFITSYFTCHPDNSTWADTAIQISQTFRTHMIEIDLQTSYDTYIVDVWVYPDVRWMTDMPNYDYLVKNAAVVGPPAIPRNIPVVLLTNNIRARYDDTGLGNRIDYSYAGYNAATNTHNYGGTATSKDTFNLRSWNHVILFLDNNGAYNLYFSTRRQHFPNDPAPLQVIPAQPLTHIYFCTSETKLTTTINQCKGQNWIDAYYKNLKVWDATWANVWTAVNHHQFIKDIPISLKHWFPLTMEYVNANKIIDKINALIVGTVPNSSIGFNPDNENFFNFATNFAWDDLYDRRFMTKVTLNQYQRLDVTDNNCNIACKRCFGANANQCLVCMDGYGIRSHECVKTTNTNSFWYYKNPPTSSVPFVNLSVGKDNLQNYPALTILWFMKIYTFTDYQYDMIIFDFTRNMKLVFNPLMANPIWGAVELWWNGILQYRYNQYRSFLFGRWIPMSICMYREYESWKYPNMNQMTIYNNLLVRQDDIIQAYSIEAFAMPKTFVGLVSDIHIYRSYITNAWSLGKWYEETFNNVKYRLNSYLLKINSNSIFCVNDYELESTTALGVGVQCVSDYNPYYNYNCGANANNCFQVDPNDDPICRCGCCGCQTGMCVYAPPAPCGCTVFGQGCDHRDRDHIAVQLFWQTPGPAVGLAAVNGRQIVCDVNNGIDFNRYQKGSIPNIQSPKNGSSFSMDLWWYTQSYVQQNFDSFNITWNYHNKMVMRYNGNFLIECYPMVDESNPTNVNTPVNMNVGAGDQQWRYFMCGVDLMVNKFFIANNGYFTSAAASSFVPPFSIPLGNTKLTFEETSTPNHGVVYFRQLRLWNCYECSLAFWRLQFLPGSPLYFNTLHAYTGYNSAGQINDQQGAANFTFTERFDFHGYNVLFYIPNPIWCNEGGFTYWNPALNNCSTLYNLARLNNVVFPDQPASRTNRWTMEFWVYIEQNFNLTNGINLIYNYHIGMTLIRDINNTSALATLCFPQEYRDDLNGKLGPDVFDLYSNALNRDQDVLDNSSSQWNFFRCAVDNDNQVMYLNDKPEISLLPEFIYGTQQEQRVYRYLDIPIYVDITLENSAQNKTRIFYKQWRIYREFLPQNTMKMKWKAMQNYNNLNTWPLVFVTDFESVGGGGLQYWTNDVDGNPPAATNNALPTFLAVDTNPLYTTYPVFYMLGLCGVNQTTDGANGCQAITAPAGCNNNTIFCQDDNEEWWCWNQRVLDVTNLTCNNDCPVNFTRMQDQLQTGGYCRLDCINNNYQTCPNTKATMTKAVYQLPTNISCNPGFTRVYYKCHPDNLIERSGFYFSSFYSFTPTVVDYVSKASSPTSYYIELWLYVDFLRQISPIFVNKHYLLAPPHQIIRRATDQLFKYSNHLISGGTLYYDLSSMNEFEWNNIIIHCQYLAYNNTYEIRIYMNYNFINPDVEIVGIDATLYPMNLRGFAFCNKPFATCTINGVTYIVEWGTAWYKNIRVWDDSLSNIYSIQQFRKTYSNNVKGKFFYYRFEIDTIDRQFLLDELNTNHNMVSIWWYPDPPLIFPYNSYDGAQRINYSIDFDYGFLNPGSYISQIDDTTFSKETVPCHPFCKRCYSSSVTNCYECNDGFAIQGNTCYAATGYYFKTPTNDTTKTTIDFIDSYVTPFTFDISTENPITITFWMRWYGIQYTLPNVTYYPIFNFYNNNSFIGFNNVTKGFMVQVEGNDAFEQTNISPIIGLWTHFAISVYRSSNPTLFPHMFNFMIQQVIQTPLPTFNVKTTQVLLNRITFLTENVALFAHLRFYKNFVAGTYGKVTATPLTTSLELIFSYPLVGSASQNCVSDAQLSGMIVGTGPTGIDLICMSDYSPYENLNIQCEDDKKFFDVSFTNLARPCGLCKSQCSTQCFKGDDFGCSCTFNSKLFWIATQEPPVDYHCYRIQSLNFSFYNPVVLTNIKNTDNDEMSIEFWVHIHSYTNLKFDFFDIIWDKHIRVRIINDTATFKAQCYPYVDKVDLNIYPFSYDINFTEKSWFYVRCASDNYYEKHYINNLIELDYPQPLPLFTRDTTSTLSINENIPPAVFNYGFSFIRELKITNSYHFQFWDPSYNYLDPTNYPFILHYFRNIYKDGENMMTDLVTGIQEPLVFRNNLIGYNYVVGFTELPQCPEGQIYLASVCQDYSSGKCKYSNNDVNNCLICADNKFLNSDGECYAKCPNRLYGDPILLQCRKCDDTCFTCFGKKINNCSSCTGNRYLVKSLNICVLSCEEYGLTISLDEPNVCGPFSARAKIINFEIKEPQNPNTFNKIEANIFNVTATGYTVRWGFSFNETMIINQNKTDPKYTQSSLVTPFSGALNNLDSSVDISFVETIPDFFDESFQYVFYLYVEKIGVSGLVTFPIQFIIQMNDYPKNGTIVSVPDQGIHKTTAFLIRCPNWEDENTEKKELLYKFTYMNEDNREITIQDYSNEEEANYVFNLKDSDDNRNYTITCYVKDKMDAINSTTTKIKVTKQTTSIYENIIKDVLEKQDFNSTNLEPYQWYKRTILLRSLTENFFRDNPIVNRTIIKPLRAINSEEQDLINKTDPNLNEDYCNKKGTPVLINKYLSCRCSGDQIGINCHISRSVLQKLDENFAIVWDGMRSTLTSESTGYVFSGLLNLLEGASYFISNSDYFLERAYDFIALAQNNYKSELLGAYEYVLRYCATGLRWGTYQINSLKADNSFKNASTVEETRNATLTGEQKQSNSIYQKELKKRCDNLVEWYGLNLPLETEGIHFRSAHYQVNITHVNNNFDFTKYFINHRGLYDPKISMKTCIDTVMREKYNKRSYKLVQTNSYYLDSPYMYEENLYSNNAGNPLQIKFYDYEDKKIVDFSDCNGKTELISPNATVTEILEKSKTDDDSLKILNGMVDIFFPVDQYILTDFLNNYRNRSDPSKQFLQESDIFSDPVYIAKDGQIDYDTPEDRRWKWWVPINFTCHHFDESKEIWDTSGCVYRNFTNDYLQCTCSHLTTFSVNYFVIPTNWFLKSRFFYLLRPEIYNWKPNIVENAALYTFSINVVVFISVLIIFACYDYYLRRLNGLLEYLKKQVIKINLPYIYNYNFNLGVIFSLEAVNRGKRATEILDDHKREQRYMTNFKITKDNNEIATTENKLNTLNIDNFNMHDVDVMVLDSNKDRNNVQVTSKTNLEILEEKKREVKNKKRDRDIMDQILDGEAYVMGDEEEDNDDIMGQNMKEAPNMLDPLDAKNKNLHFNNYLDADQQVQQYTNARVISDEKLKENDQDFEEDIQELPLLNKELSYEAILQEFSAAQLSGWEFFKENILRRHFLISSFRYSLVYGRFRKIGNFCTYINIVYCCLSIWLTYDGLMVIKNMPKDPILILKLLGYCVSTAVFASLMVYPIGMTYYINLQEFRDLYYVIVTNPGLKIFTKWEALFDGKWIRTTIAISISLIWFAGSFYVTFGFLIVYKYQMITWVIMLIITLILDLVIFEIFWEMLLAWLYSMRKESRLKLQVAEYLNRLRDMKILP